MSLRDALVSAAAAIFDVTSDLCYDITYKQVGASSYDTATGVTTENVVSTTTIASVVDKDSRHDLIGDHVDEVEVVILVLASYLVGITPKIGDLVTIDSVERKVVDRIPDPAKIVWELGLR